MKAEGDGEAIWHFDFPVRTEYFEMASAPDTSKFIGYAWDSANVTLLVYQWASSSTRPPLSPPTWEYSVKDVSPVGDVIGGKGIFVSGDGSHCAVGSSTIDYALGSRGRVDVLDMRSAQLPPPVTVVSQQCCPRQLAIDRSGRWVGAFINSSALVIDASTGHMTHLRDVHFSASDLALSGDAKLLSYGFMTITLEKASVAGGPFTPAWSYSLPQHYVYSVDISEDGSTIVVGWSSFQCNQNVVQVYDPTGTLLWQYEYKTSPAGQGQDIPDTVLVCPDGSAFAVLSWGDFAHTNPEIEVFARSKSDGPIFTYAMPGSMFGGSLLCTSDFLYVGAGGKHVHANTMGKGGDFVSLKIAVAH